ncbi:MAG TPA: YceI family protein [Planctomycetaceae bacterium]|nr:YceI family protein [Planctomycetaceae bacterium]
MNRSKSVGILFVLSAGGVLAATNPAWAQVRGQSPESRSEFRPSRLRPNEIDTDLSRIFVFVDKTGFGHQHGVVGRIKGGYLRVAKESAGKILFDMSSFRADTRDARRRVGLEGTSSNDEQQQVTANMLGESVLDVAHFPTALFTVTSMRRFEERNPSGLKQYALDGEFTLHGVTRVVNISATGEQEQGYLHLKGQFPLRQTDFEIRPFKKALGAVGVGDVLTVYGDLWIKQ